MARSPGMSRLGSKSVEPGPGFHFGHRSHGDVTPSESLSAVAPIRSSPVDAGIGARTTAMQRTAMGDDPMWKSFLAFGDYLINPDLLAYAIVENDGADLASA